MTKGDTITHKGKEYIFLHLAKNKQRVEYAVCKDSSSKLPYVYIPLTDLVDWSEQLVCPICEEKKELVNNLYCQDCNNSISSELGVTH